MPAKYWSGSPPASCEMCHKPIKDVFIDGKVRQMGWAHLCETCHHDYGTGLGEGKGQKYEKQTDGKWLKVAFSPMGIGERLYKTGPDEDEEIESDEEPVEAEPEGNPVSKKKRIASALIHLAREITADPFIARHGPHQDPELDDDPSYSGFESKDALGNAAARNLARLKTDLMAAAKDAHEAALKQYASLLHAGPQFEVVPTDFSGKPTGPSQGVMHDVCGNAHVKFMAPKNGMFIKAFKALAAQIPGSRMGGDSWTIPFPPMGRVWLFKSSRGYSFSVFSDALTSKLGPACQYMSINEAEQRAAMGHLVTKGWLKDARVETHID